MPERDKLLKAIQNQKDMIAAAKKLAEEIRKEREKEAERR